MSGYKLRQPLLDDNFRARPLLAMMPRAEPGRGVARMVHHSATSVSGQAVRPLATRWRSGRAGIQRGHHGSVHPQRNYTKKSLLRFLLRFDGFLARSALIGKKPL